METAEMHEAFELPDYGLLIQQQRDFAIKQQAEAQNQLVRTNEAYLREKALMYAVQAMPNLTPGVDVLDVAVKFADYLSGGAK